MSIRHTATQPKPNTEDNSQLGNKTAKILKNYPDKLFRGQFDGYNAKTVQYQPQDLGRGQSCARHLFETGDESRHYRTTDTWTLDLTETTIDLTTFVGGIIDGIAQINGRDYHIWSFLDQNFQWAGMGITHKPYSNFSAYTNGTKGSSSTFTVTDAHQFVVGARIMIRNLVGTAPLYEYNWGIVTAVTSSTSITVLMDNNSGYGTAITGTTGGEIIQWNKFRPNVVTGGGATLYAPYYSLVGECYTDGGTGDITWAYRADEDWRQITLSVLSDSNPTAGSYPLDMVRYIPLWTTEVQAAMFFGGGAGGLAILDGIFTDDSQIYQLTENYLIECRFKPQANTLFTLRIAANPSVSRVFVGVKAYQVSGGMKG